MRISLQSSTATTDLFVLPLPAPLPPAPRLIAPERANIGDFIGVFGGITHRRAPTFKKKTHIEVAYTRGLIEPENAFIDEMSDADAAAFKEIAALPFGGLDHHRIVRQVRMVEDGQPYQIHLAQFADAILYVHPHWLGGIWGLQYGHEAIHPLVMMLKGASSHEEAARCLEKARRYMKLFRSALPPTVRSMLPPHLKFPDAQEFFATDGPDPTSMRAPASTPSCHIYGATGTVTQVGRG